MATALPALPIGDQTLTLQNLLAELVEVSHWQLLASYLEVPKKKRSKIGTQYDRELERCKEGMLDWWLKSSRQPSWERLAQALEKMGHHKDIVERIWRKYIAPPPAEPRPNMQLYWKRYTELPIKARVPQVVVIAEKIYMVSHEQEASQIFCYHPARCKWSTLPPYPMDVWSFSLGQLSGELLMVGGYSNGEDDESAGAVGAICCFREELQKWDELHPMPTGRANASIVSTPSVLIVAGGHIVDLQSDEEATEAILCTAVEVYQTDTLQWSTTDPLPAPAFRISAIIISNTFYFMGLLSEDTPTVTVLGAPVSSLIKNAVCVSDTHQSASASPRAGTTSVWKKFGNLPSALTGCTATTLGGVLLGYGGTIERESRVEDESRVEEDGTAVSHAVTDDSDEDSDDSEGGFSPVMMHAYSPATESWVRVHALGDAPQIDEMDLLGFMLSSFNAVEMSGNRLLAIGYAGDKAVMYVGVAV